MAIRQSIISHDVYFRNSVGDKIIVNDLNLFSLTDLNTVNNSLMTTYNNTDVLSTIPSCDCGNTKGRYLVNTLCHECGTKCVEVHEKVQPLLWLKTLEPNIRFLNPDFWIMLKNIMDKKTDWVRWMCDSRYNPPVKLQPFVFGLKDTLDGVRTYENTMLKLPQIIKYLLTNSKFKDPEKQENLTLLLDIYNKNKDILFSEYLPIINKKLFVMENTSKGRFTSLATSDVIDVVLMWIKAANVEKHDSRKNSIITASVISKLGILYHTYFEDYISQKIGIFRKHVYGGRSHFTFRAVITAIPGVHEHDDIHVPWGIGVTAFRPHILNKLYKIGITHKKALSMMFKAVKKYDPIISTILDQLIEESPYKGIPIILHRNPALLQGSSQLVFITKFKQDPMVNGVSISDLVVKSPNADFDGDECNFIILLDNLMAEEFKTLSPYYNIADTSKPFSVSGNLTLLSPATSVLSNYLSDHTEDIENDTIVDKLNFV